MIENNVTKAMVRFDFPPGATPEQIATAIRAAGERLMRERAEAIARGNDYETRSITEKGPLHG